MKLRLSHSYNTLSLLEPAWVLTALLLFSAGPVHGGTMAIGLVFLSLSFLQRKIFQGYFSRPTPFDPPWAFLLIGALAGLLASYDASRGLPALLMLAGCIALYYVAANAHQPEMLAYAALLVGLIAAIYFLLSSPYLLGKMGIAPRLFPDSNSWEPFSNSVATLLEGLIPLGIMLTLSGRSRNRRMVGGAVTAVMGLAILAAASYDVWGALLAAGVLWLASRRKAGLILLIATICVALAALAGYLILAPNVSLESIPLAGPALHQLVVRSDRLQVYQGSLHLIQDYPITGIGLGDVFGQVYSQYVLLIPHVFLIYSHNLYLTIWLGHGLIGITGMGWLLAALGYLVLRERQKGTFAPLFQAAWVGAAAILIHGLFDARQYIDLWTMWPLFALLGLAVSGSSIVPESRLRPATHLKWKWIVPLLLLAGCILAWRPLAATVYANLGTVKQTRSELAADLPPEKREAHLQAAITNYNQALKLEPNNQTALTRLGNLAVTAGRYKEGVTHLEAALQTAPKDPTLRKALGLAYTWVGKTDAAAELLHDTKDIVAELNTWGWWHQSEGRQQAAMNAYQTSLALKPDQPQIQDLLNTLDSTDNKD